MGLGLIVRGFSGLQFRGSGVFDFLKFLLRLSTRHFIQLTRELKGAVQGLWAFGFRFRV